MVKRDLLQLGVIIYFVICSTAFGEIVGASRVIDGDTIEVSGQHIRLYGIDAPERTQKCLLSGVSWRCGIQAMLELQKLIGQSDVTCVAKGQDRYKRIVAICDTKSKNLNTEMVKSGFALAYTRYSRDYVHFETIAKTTLQGLWRGSFIQPWEWRRGKRLSLMYSRKNNNRQKCLIKGNISSQGSRIYHLPGGPWYKRTVIQKAKGERWFCSESAAIKAGWRRAKTFPHNARK